MHCIVTGVAGFIGSHLAEALLGYGHTVAGIDCFTPYYARERKMRNLASLRGVAGFAFHELNLSRDDLTPVLRGAEWVFHQAAQAGVRASWGHDFATYLDCNVLATQRLLEALAAVDTMRGLVYASSSSIYGDAETLPTREESLPRPISPYGVTKLAGEHLCRAYARAQGFTLTVLRYFTVYGPRQRPDMGFYRFITAALCDAPIEIYGDGRQTRDYTYVTDAVAANLAAMEREADGVFNIGGGTPVDLLDVLRQIERLCGRPLRLNFTAARAGDVRDTCADTAAAAARLGYVPRVTLEAGLAQQIAWVQEAVRDG